jgi:hypothetical protein
VRCVWSTCSLYELRSVKDAKKRDFIKHEVSNLFYKAKWDSSPSTSNLSNVTSGSCDSQGIQFSTHGTAALKTQLSLGNRQSSWYVGPNCQTQQTMNNQCYSASNDQNRCDLHALDSRNVAGSTAQYLGNVEPTGEYATMLPTYQCGNATASDTPSESAWASYTYFSL